MLVRLAALLVVATTLGPQSAPAPTPGPDDRVLQLTFNPDGTVSLLAKGVTTPQILAEWTRLCGCIVVNGERLAGGAVPVPLVFEHASQQSVLASLLREAAGFTLTPRRAGSSAPSAYETIYILPRTSAVQPASAVAAGTPAALAPADQGVSPRPPQVVTGPDELPFVPASSVGTNSSSSPAAGPGPGVFVRMGPPPPAPKPAAPAPASPTTGRGGGGGGR